MLTLTDNAAEAVKTVISAVPDAPDDAGLRIFAEPTPDTQGVGLGLAIAETPAESDQVVEEAGARVFVDTATAAYLDDKVLDASVAEEGVRFTLSEQ